MKNEYSVVIPAYNAEATIAEALASILNQTYMAKSIIVVDDGSDDDTAEIARSMCESITVIQQKNLGCGAATNVGLAQVKTEYIAFLDADDVWHKLKAEIQLKYLSKHEEISMVCTQVQTFSGMFEHAKVRELENPSVDLWGRTTMMMRTQAARQIGDVIDPTGGRGDMVDWIARGKELGQKYHMHPSVLAYRRIRPESLSYGRDRDKDRGYLQVVKLALERKRAQQKDA